MPEFTFTFDWAGVIQLVLVGVLPLLVGLVTTRVTSSRVKAVLLALLSFVSSLLTEILAAAEAGVAYDLWQGLLNGLLTFIGAVALHYGFWKPVGASEAAQNALNGKPVAQGEAVDDSPDQS